MRKPQYSIKSSPNNTDLPLAYKVPSIIWTLIYCFRKIVCHLWRIQRHYISTVTHFSQLVRHQRGLKTQSCCATQPKCTLLHPPKVYRKYLKYRYLHIMDTHQWSQCVSALEGFYRIPKYRLQYVKNICTNKCQFHPYSLAQISRCLSVLSPS